MKKLAGNQYSPFQAPHPLSWPFPVESWAQLWAPYTTEVVVPSPPVITCAMGLSCLPALLRFWPQHPSGRVLPFPISKEWTRISDEGYSDETCCPVAKSVRHSIGRTALLQQPQFHPLDLHKIRCSRQPGGVPASIITLDRFSHSDS